MLKTNKTYKAALERLNRYIKAHGMRPSAVRNMVLEKMCNLHQPFLAEQLVAVCQEERVSVGTVYNTLNICTKAEIIRGHQRQRGHIATEYEIINDTSKHMQFVCKKCGRTVDFSDKAIAQLIEERKYSNFDVHQFSLIVYGECKMCRKVKIERGKVIDDW